MSSNQLSHTNPREEIIINNENDKEGTANNNSIQMEGPVEMRTDVQDFLEDKCLEIQQKNAQELPFQNRTETTYKLDTNRGAYKLNEKTLKPSVWIQYNQGYGGYDSGGYDAPLHYNPQSRNYFVKVVLTILLLMLLCTAGYITAVFMILELKSFYMSLGLGAIIALGVGLMILNYVIACVPQARTAPCCYILLVVAVVLMSNFAAAITVKYETHIVFYAFIATSVTVFVCILLACSSFDFTKFYIYLVAIAVVVCTITTVIFVAMFAMEVRYKPLTMALLFICALINVAFLIMELQMVLGGRSVELNENEYAFGAYLLYMSIVDLFIKMVQLIGLADD